MKKVLLLTALMSLGALAPAAAQFPPDSLVNLQVLPEDIGIRELINTMRGFATGLGVRCQHCHVGEEGMPLAEFDFPADEKATKAKAREMLRMVQAINGEHLANLANRSDPPIEVTCATCHHGLNKPISLEDDLLHTHASEGVDATIARYRELREQYYGGWQYDFGIGTLNGVAEELGVQGHFDDGMALLDLSLEFDPENAFVYVARAQLMLRKGDRDVAIQNMERAVELSDNDPGMIRFLNQMRGNN